MIYCIKCLTLSPDLPKVVETYSFDDSNSISTRNLRCDRCYCQADLFPLPLRLQFGLVPHYCGLLDMHPADSVVSIFTFFALSPVQLTTFAFNTDLSLSL